MRGGRKAVRSMASSGEPAPLEGGDAMPFEMQAIYDAALTGTNYDSLAVAASFLEQCESDVTLVEHWQTWKPDHSVIINTYNGSNCVGLALKLQEAGVSGKLLISSKSNHPHLALGLQFCNPKHVDDSGIILMDPGLHFPKPLAVRRAYVSTVFVGERAHLLGYGTDSHQALKISLAWPWQMSSAKRAKSDQPLVAPEATIISDITYKREGNKIVINKTPRFFFLAETVTPDKIESVGKSTIPLLSYSVVKRANNQLFSLSYDVKDNAITIDRPEAAKKRRLPLTGSKLTDAELALIEALSKELDAPNLPSALQAVVTRRDELTQFVEELNRQTP